MEEAESSRRAAMQTLKPSMTSTSSSSSALNPPNRLDTPSFHSTAFGRPFCRQFPPSLTPKRPGGIPPHNPFLPPTSPYSQIPPNFTPSPSQPSFFSPDDPSAASAVAALSLSDPSDGIPPRKAHRRSQSDIPFSGLPPLPQHLPLGSVKHRSQFVKQEEAGFNREGDDSDPNKSDGDVGDDLISAYMNLDGLALDNLNSSGAEDRNDLDSRASGSKTNGAESSENEAESESSMNEGLRRMGERKERNKRSADGDPAGMNNMPPRQHCRSVSMDSFMGNLSFCEERHAQHSRGGSMDGAASTFSLEFGNGEFSGAELKKIMANEKLSEIAMNDPKKAKRILANRQSAARSKDRKMRYITELEHKVQTLRTEAITLSAQLTVLQRDSAGLTSQNNHLKFRLQAMEQQAQLRDALNEALSSEVQRLKLANGEPISASTSQQIQLNPQMFQLQQHFQKQHQSPEQQVQQQNADATDHEMKA